MNAWDAAAEELAAAGCGLVTGVVPDEPGLLDAATCAGRLLAVSARDQRAAAAIAAGFTSASGRPSVVALATGPAFANAVAALSEIASLALPAVVVTTSVRAEVAGRGAFQELDQRALSAVFAKWFHRVERAADLRWALRYAVHVARSGCPGVAVVEIAPEACDQPIPGPGEAAGGAGRPRALSEPDALRAAAAAIDRAAAPLIVAGGGAKAAGAGPAIARLAERCAAPVLTTAAGRGTVDETSSLAIGLAGLYAAPPIAVLADRADLVLAVGTRLEETARMGWSGLGASTLVHVDVDAAAFGRPHEPAVALLGDAGLTVAALADLVSPGGANRARWRTEVEAARRAASDLLDGEAGRSRAAAAVAAAGRVHGPDASYVFENGLHDIWAYQWPLLRVRSGVAVAPGEQTMMGFGLPAAIGTALARPSRPVVLFSGDGAFAMHPAALATAAELGLPLTAVVFDNAGFGWPRLHRRNERPELDRLTRFARPLSACAVAESLGVWSAVARDPADVLPALRTALVANERGEPAVLVVPVADDDVPVGVRRTLA